MFDRPDTGEKALLVHAGRLAPAEEQDQIREFRELVLSAGIEIIDCVECQRAKPDPKHYVGSGKLEEIASLVSMSEAEVVLFNQALSPSQERNLEGHLKARVLDRNALILDIFAQRARSFEGKLQVELAQLVHLSTRLVRGWTHLERQKGGIGLRGPGETQLETDRRLLAVRVKTIKRRLERVRRQRQQGRQMRGKSGVPTVALVGYTNAGKSTLFNRLTSEQVYAADQLFATLDPTLRKLSLAGGRHCILADTVGFIRDLPHELVDAFRSTLVETREADLLLHVLDASDDEKDERRRQVDQVLHEIGADDVPQLLVYNKSDRLGLDSRIEYSKDGLATSVWLSALTGDGVELVQQAMVDYVGKARVEGWLRLLPAEGKLRAMLFEAGAVVSETVQNDGCLILQIDVDKSIWESWCSQHPLEDRFSATEALLAASGGGQ